MSNKKYMCPNCGRYTLQAIPGPTEKGKPQKNYFCNACKSEFYFREEYEYFRVR